MGNTTNLNLPYPENTDPLANAAAAVQSLAEAIDAGPGATASGSLTTTGVSSGGVSWSARGKVITVNIQINSLSANITAGASQTVVSAANGLAAAYRPSAAKYAAVFSGTAVGFGRVNTDGSVAVTASTGTLTGPYGTIVYTV